jgi:uncharacterized protein YjbI with pentapeptide repeats
MKIHQTREPIEATTSNLSGSSFRDVNLAGAVFDDVKLTDARINNICMSGVQITDANLQGASIRDSIDGVPVSEMVKAYAAAKGAA